MVFLFDIDGTLANIDHRVHFIQKEPKDWRGFFAACDHDQPIREVIEINRSLNSAGNFSVLVTGRSNEIRGKTEHWLAKHGVYWDRLYMRKPDDHREDSIVKAELLELILADWKIQIERDGLGGVFEDRQQVVDMYRERGLRVFQVAPGKF